MIRFCWIRHGPTHEKVFTGWRDVPADLSDRTALSRLHQGLPNDATVVSSDLSRAVTTADAIQGDRIRLPHDEGLRELNFGDWDGKKWDLISENNPDLSRLYWEEPGDHAPPNGESWNEAAHRVSTAVDTLINADIANSFIVVAHFGTILTQLCRASGKSPYETLAQEIDNLSLTELTWDDGTWSVGRINHQF